ncbi:unnamed protein product, partial [Brenthis ino]
MRLAAVAGIECKMPGIDQTSRRATERWLRGSRPALLRACVLRAVHSAARNVYPDAPAAHLAFHYLPT